MEEPTLCLQLEENVLQETPMILVGKVISDKPVEVQQMIDNVNKAWKTKEGFSVSYWGNKIFAFQFRLAEDVKKILNKSPWFVLGNLLLLQEWELKKSFEELRFDLCPFWVQIHGLPRSYFTESNAKTIAGSLGTLVSFEGLGVDTPVLSHLRLRILVDVSKPLIPGFNVKGKDGDSNRWASVKYESLGNFCLFCGRLGHVESWHNGFGCRDTKKYKFIPLDLRSIRAEENQTYYVSLSGNETRVQKKANEKEQTYYVSLSDDDDDNEDYEDEDDDDDEDCEDEDENEDEDEDIKITGEVEYRCFVGGLAWSTDEGNLTDAFSKFGEVIDSKIIKDRETGRSRGFGFVTFKDKESMDNAIDKLNGSDLNFRSITVNQAQARGSGSGYGGGGYYNWN